MGCLLASRMALWGQTPAYTFPAEWVEHEGTWLQWPHDYTYGPGTRDYYEPAWIEMTRQLIKGEMVHIVAYNAAEQTHIENTLSANGISLDSVDFFIHPNNDFWVRDNGPIFITDQDDYLYATDWNFNGWGNDAPYTLCNLIPGLIADDLGVPSIDLSAITLEGGAVEHDGNGTFIGTESSILGDGRNPGITTSDLEGYMSEYFGFTHYIWLDGYYGAGWDITDAHIDGFVKFADENTLVTMNNSDLIYWFVTASDRTKINNAVNANGDPYNFVYLPLTHKNVKTTDGINTGSKGDYINYYVANAVVLVPIYMDDNDATALSIIQGLYPDKEVVGIDSRNMFYVGGMVHCVTQQQPAVCSTPRNLIVSDLTATSCKISWDTIPQINSYRITRKQVGGATVNFNVTVPSKIFTDLIPGATYKFTVKAKCDAGFSDKSLTKTVHVPLRSGDYQPEISVFPNPASATVQIFSTTEYLSGQLIDASGREMMIFNYESSQLLDISALPDGIYFIRLNYEKGTVVEKLMVSK